MILMKKGLEGKLEENKKSFCETAEQDTKRDGEYGRKGVRAGWRVGNSDVWYI